MPRNSDFRNELSRSHRVGCCGEGIGSMAEVADGAIKASWPGLSRPSTKAQRIDAGKREKPCDRPPSCRPRRGGTRSCGGPAWMAGTSPAMTARVRRTTTVRLPAGRGEAGLVLAAARRGWPDKPGHDGKGSTNEQQTGRPTHNAIRANCRQRLIRPPAAGCSRAETRRGGRRRNDRRVPRPIRR